VSEVKRPMINEALRLIRLYWGYSQIDLSNELELSQSMISEIERGTKQVSMEVLERYRRKLGVRMSQLMFFAEEIEGEPPQKRGKLIIANRVLQLLDALSPADASNA
jgi:transcriptional regulator with XRE-family HTH domain